MKKESKYLALLLRHKPEVGNLTLDQNGWAPVGDVVAALRAKFGTFSRSMLDTLVRDNDKQRFAFDEHGVRIRANQGHSQEIDLALEPKEPPARLFHGTKARFLDSIFRDGLLPQSRQHVHLSPDRATAEKVAARRSGTSVILIIDTARVDTTFYLSANGVWLADRIPPEALMMGE